ncbi:D-alanyl-D-alanine carboxypeptidase family protein [Anaerorhabdus sp.]|uniref:D-alanyl-D-alanine carboxypeptidase family protein n=1 Tax=Anaerorhabdus sp. TaxID=1872524 RepID=UPI002FC650CB
MKKILIICMLIVGYLFAPLQIQAEEEKPEITSDYVYMFDRTTGQVFWDKGSTEKIYPASMTKIMTALVAIENITDFDQQVLIDETIMAGLKEAGASRAGFNVGDVVTMRDLVYGTLLPSGAECTQALAYTISGSVEGYVDLMNQKAQEIGMTNTHYANTTGLHDDNHYSTLQDIALLLEYALKNEEFYQVFTSDTYQAGTSFNYPTQGLKMESTSYKYINNPASNLPYQVTIDGFLGSKSGYTVEARYCLASIATINDMDIMLITAHAWIERKIPSHYLDAGIIYNTYRDLYQRATVFNEGDTIQESVMKYRFFNKEVDWLMPQTLIWDLPIDIANYQVDITIPEVIDENIKKGDVVGQLVITSFGDEVYRQDIISDQDYNQNFILLTLGNTGEWMVANPLVSVFGGVLIVGSVLVLIVRKSRNSKKS